MLKTCIPFMIALHLANGVLEEECGMQGTFDKILGGEDTAIDEFPWLARIGYKNLKTANVTYACGGALISKRAVLTAGHCMDYLHSNGQMIHNVVLGEYDTSSVEDCVEMLGFKDCADPVQNIEIDSYIVHPNYLNGYNDIGVIFLKEDVHYSDFVQPACLPPKDTAIDTDEKFIVSGWGRTESGSESPVKLKVTVPIRNFAECAHRYLSEKHVILNNDYHLCAGRDGEDTCTGDSGLPLVSTKGNDTRWKVFGITSRGYKCGQDNWPGVYTKVSAFVDWIEAVTSRHHSSSPSDQNNPGVIDYMP